MHQGSWLSWVSGKTSVKVCLGLTSHLSGVPAVPSPRLTELAGRIHPWGCRIHGSFKATMEPGNPGWSLPSWWDSPRRVASLALATLCWWGPRHKSCPQARGGVNTPKWGSLGPRGVCPLPQGEEATWRNFSSLRAQNCISLKAAHLGVWWSLSSLPMTCLLFDFPGILGFGGYLSFICF